MFLVDSSVWIDFFRAAQTPQVKFLDEHILAGQFIVGDLILIEVLQGTRTDREFERVLKLLSVVRQMQISSRGMAIKAAQNYRRLRERGITVRKTIDTLIATRCIEDGIPLLWSDKDFDPFRDHLGLIDALDAYQP